MLVVDEHPRYHAAGCRWAGTRETIPLPVDEARTDGFTPCAVCSPDRTLAAPRPRTTASPDTTGDGGHDARRGPSASGAREVHAARRTSGSRSRRGGRRSTDGCRWSSTCARDEPPVVDGTRLHDQGRPAAD